LLGGDTGSRRRSFFGRFERAPARPTPATRGLALLGRDRKAARSSVCIKRSERAPG